jgi:hypothetical protein
MFGSGPKINAALTSNHHWLIINCDSCGTVVDLDLQVKPRDPEASIRVALRDVQCPRCNGYGRPRIIALAAPVDLKKGAKAMVMALARTACRWERRPQRVGGITRSLD